ncbi:MAG TPA: hypothetical protein VM925_02325 [Labilithrix sp.]|nr:hypothetical protein [Labilithrix sp.]
MRSLLALAACSLLAVLPACTEKIVTVQGAPAPTPTAGSAESAKETEAPETVPPVEKETAVSDPLIDLGDVSTGTDVTFTIPEGALGFQITAEGSLADLDPSAPFGIERITAPDGKIVHDEFMPKGGSHATSFAAFDAIASASVPQGEGVVANLAGKWKVRFGVMNDRSTKLQLRGRVRVQSSGDGAFHGGTLDLHVHVPRGLEIGDHVVDATSAAKDGDIADRLDTFFALTSQLLGIEKGDVVFHAESESLRELDGYADIAKGFAVSRGEKDGTQAFHVLLTNVIALNGEPVAAGISPGIPGAAKVFGRNVSGIIIAMSWDAEGDAVTMLHETGHFFGLNHTTEIEGGYADPLDDTPACADISYDPEALYACPDRANIMFPLSALEGEPELSPTQKRIYRGSSIYKALPAGAAKTSSFRARVVPRRTQPPFRISGGKVLSPVEHELALGFCGLDLPDASRIVSRHGRPQAVAQLRAAAADADLAPYIRGRATLALQALGEK